MSALKGIRVLELGRVPPLELPGMMLADMGADVIKVESPNGIEADEQAAENARRSYTNRNKRSVILDLKTASGVSDLMNLVRESDVVVEGFRPGVVKRLGVDYDSVRALNPRLVYCSMSSFGQTGPDRLKPGHDLNFLARSGALSLIHAAGGHAGIPLNLIADNGGAALHAALAIMFALFARERGGPGQFIDISYLDCTVALLAATPNLRQLITTGHVPRADQGVFCGDFPYYGVYAARDGCRLAVACSEAHLWSNFCGAIGLPELAVHSRSDEHYRRCANAAELEARAKVQARLLERDASEWMSHLNRFDVCVTLVNDIEQVLADPQLQARGMVSVEGGRVRFGSPFQLSVNTPVTVGRGPVPGEHTASLLG